MVNSLYTPERPNGFNNEVVTDALNKNSFTQKHII